MNGRTPIGIGLLLAAIAVLAMAVWPLPRSCDRDYLPPPDAPEYLAGAVALATTGRHTIEIAGETLPSRYPIGFSGTIAPWIIVGADPIRAPFFVSATAALLLLLVVFLSVRVRAGPIAAGLGALLLATTPAFLVLARAPLSEMTASLWTTTGAILCLAYVQRPDLRLGLLGAFVLGLATIFRLGNLFLAPLVLGSWLSTRKRVERPMQHAIVLGLAMAAGCVPVLVSQWATFGNPLETGYAFWIPDRAGITDSFGLSHLFDNLRYLARDFAQLEWKKTVATFYGNGSYFGPAGFVLLLLCLGRAVRRPNLRWPALGIAAYAIVMLCYFFQDARFFFAIVPLAAMLVAWQSLEILRSASRPLKLATATLLALHCSGVPGNTAIAEVPALLAAAGPQHARRFELIEELQKHPPGLVLSTFSPPYGKVLLGIGWTVSPARDAHDYRWSPGFRYRSPRREAQVGAFVAATTPVYLMAEESLDAAIAETPPPEGHSWVVVMTATEGGGTAVLRRER